MRSFIARNAGVGADQMAGNRVRAFEKVQEDGLPEMRMGNILPLAVIPVTQLLQAFLDGLAVGKDVDVAGNV